MTFFSNFAFAALFLLASLPALVAQEVREVTVRSLCFQQVDDVETLYFKNAGKEEFVEIPLWTRSPSDDIKVKVAGEDFVFYRKTENEAGEQIYQKSALAKATQNSRFLLFFVPAGKDKEQPYLVEAFPDDEKSFPLGATRLVNFANVPAYFQMGEIETTLKPGEIKIVGSPKRLNNYRDYNFVIQLETEGGRYPVRQTRGKASDSKRGIAVVYLDPRRKRAAVNLYKDIPPWTLPSLLPEEGN